MSKDDLVKKGQAVYTAHCAACHQASGAGLPPTFPSLHGDKVTNGPAEAHITQILKGLNMMQPFAQLSDEEIAAVATRSAGRRVGTECVSTCRYRWSTDH